MVVPCRKYDRRRRRLIVSEELRSHTDGLISLRSLRSARLRKRAPGHMIRTKIEWRRALLKARSAIPKDVHRHDSSAIAHRVGRISCVANVRTVLSYRAIGAEVDPSEVFALHGLAELPRYLPVPTEDGAPRWSAWLRSAAPTDIVHAAELLFPVLVLVPAVGFDRHGVRLGRGAGFYDRALADLRKCGRVYAVGLAFECQVVSALPADSWDERVDGIVTERRLIGFGDQVIIAQECPR